VNGLRRPIRPTVSLITLLLLLFGCEATPVPILTPTPKPLHQVFGPSFAAAPPSGNRTRVDDATISADGLTLAVAFTGGPGYSSSDFCSTDYEPWVAIDGDVLQLAITKLTHRDQATAAPNMACAAMGYPYTFDLRLPRPFLGSTIEDLAGGTLWVRDPHGLVTPRVLPVGWELRLSRDEPASNPPLYARVYAAAGSSIEAPNRGAGQLDLYQAFGERTNISGGSERHDVRVSGESAIVWRDPQLGELLLQFNVAGDGVALVANEADMTIDELLEIAEGVEAAK